MKITTSLFFAAIFAVVASANPTAVIIVEGGDYKEATYYAETKSAEDCVAIIGLNESFVSCEVSYELRAAKTSVPSAYLSVTLPVFVSKGDRSPEDELLKRYRPTIEFLGKVHLPDLNPVRFFKDTDLRHYGTPADAEVVLFRFTIALGPKQSRATLLASYIQPTIGGRFLYVPLFEDRTKRSGFLLDAIAQNQDLRLHINEPVVAYKSRLKVPMRHGELISIQVAQPNF